MEPCFVSQPQFIHTNNTGIVGELVRIANLALPTNLILLEHVRSAYATARDRRKVFPADYTIKGYLKTVRRMIAAPMKSLFKLTQKGYYWENWVLDSVTP